MSPCDFLKLFGSLSLIFNLFLYKDRDVTSVNFWGMSEVALRNFSWVQYVALQKYIVLQFLPCEMANFQGWGGGGD